MYTAAVQVPKMVMRYFMVLVIGLASLLGIAAPGIATPSQGAPLSGSPGETPSGGKAGAQYLGCYMDKQVRDLQGAVGPGPSNAACQAFCGEKGFRFAATQWGSQCFCGNSYGRYGRLPESSCNLGCSGNPSEKCGGWWASSVYEVGKPRSTATHPRAHRRSSPAGPRLPPRMKAEPPGGHPWQGS